MSAEAVRAAGGGVEAGAGDGLLDQGIDGFGMEWTGDCPVALVNRTEHWALPDPGLVEPAGEGSDRAAGGVAGAWEYDELAMVPRPYRGWL